MKDIAFPCADGPFKGTRLLCFGEPKEGFENTSSGWAFGQHVKIHYVLTRAGETWEWRFADAQEQGTAE